MVISMSLLRVLEDVGKRGRRYSPMKFHGTYIIAADSTGQEQIQYRGHNKNLHAVEKRIQSMSMVAEVPGVRRYTYLGRDIARWKGFPPPRRPNSRTNARSLIDVDFIECINVSTILLIHTARNVSFRNFERETEPITSSPFANAIPYFLRGNYTIIPTVDINSETRSYHISLLPNNNATQLDSS